MADFLLELRSEEIPARMQARARNELARMFAECTAQAGLLTGHIESFSTPRRLVVIARDVADASQASCEEIKGPRTSAPPQALDGFLRKTGLSKDSLEERDGVYFAVIERAGRAAADVIAETIKRIISEFSWPKSMRWGEGPLRWVRPLHGIVAILAEDIVPVAVEGVASGASTIGHRFHHPGLITLGGASDYVEKLRACHVIVNQEERERLIRDGAAAAAEAAGLSLLADEGLVVENAGLTEWPVPLLGRFDPEFLDVPREVIVLTMRTNQKYFACINDQGLLAPAFVCVANIAATDDGESIIEGNRRVLAARLSDARFFWEQDLKIPLDDQAIKLSSIVFHEKLGTIADKSERMAQLAHWFVGHALDAGGRNKAEDGKTPGSSSTDNDVEAAELASQAERAARLAKADLVTGMVGEFPELQGVIGGYLADAQGEKPAIAEAIRTQYATPAQPVALAVALADRFDTLVGFFLERMPPTGSKDPFALRRAALGIIEMITANGLRFGICEAITRASTLYARQRMVAPSPTTDPGSQLAKAVLVDLVAFFADRLKVQQRDAGVRHDLIDAVFALGGEDDLVRLLARVNALQNFVGSNEGTDLLTAYKRAANILKKEDWTGPQVMSSSSEQGIPQTGEEDPLVLVEEPAIKEAVAEMASGHAGANLVQEQSLIAALDEAEPTAAYAIEAEDFTSAMAALASLRVPIDDFFDHVTVNDPDPPTRERRLNLLMRFRDAVDKVADFSRIES